MSGTEFYRRVLRIISCIPAGRVATYGLIAHLAGNPSGARGVAWILHSSSHIHDLPWHRVINRKGMISLPSGGGREEQRVRLHREGIRFDRQDRIDLHRYLWQPANPAEQEDEHAP